MRKILYSIFILLLAASYSHAQIFGGGTGTGVKTDSNCNQAQYYPIGTLCQDTDDGKLYKGTGAAVSEITSGTGIAADGSVAWTGAPVPNAANTIAIGSTSAEWADLYLGDGAIIYGQNDQSNTLTSAATGWSANLLFTANAGLAVKQGSTGAGFIDIYEDSDDGSNKIRIQAQAMAGDLTYILPSSAIVRGSILKGSSTANTLDWLAVGAAGTVLAGGTDPAFSASPSLTSANLVGANSLGLGTASTNTGAINFKNSGNANELVLQAGATAATITYTLPAAAPAANGAVLTGNTDGTLAFNVNPALSTLNLTGANTLGLGTAGSAVGSINFKNATSGSITVQPITGALGTPTLVLGTTYTDAKWCSYATATGLTCNQDAPAGSGDFKADGSVAMTGAPVPNAANTIALGSTSAEWADLYLGDGAIIYGQNDQSNTLTSAATGWSANLLFTANAGLAVKNGATGPGFINLYEDSDDGSNYVAIKSQAMASNYDLVLPASLGAANTLVGMNSGGTALEFKSTISATLDNAAAQFADSSVATKKMKIDPSGMTATKTATIAGACTDDCTITLPSATATLATTGANTFGGTQALGANNLTMTGSIASTGSRVTKGWFTDIESTNMPTVGGTAILTSLTAPQFTTIELGHASDTTIARVSAGVVSIEGVNIATVGAANTFTGTNTFNGAVNIGDGGDDIKIKLQKNTSDGTWNGITLNLTCAATTAFGQLVYIDSNGKAALADADAASTMPAVAINVVACANADDTGTFLTHGVISETDWNWTAGQTLYVSEAAGGIENTVSNISDANDVVQVIGVALGADTILFNPSLTTVVVK